MNTWRKIDAVKIYPSGGLIYKAARSHEVMSVERGTRQFLRGSPVVISLDDLRVFMAACEEINKEKSLK